MKILRRGSTRRVVFSLGLFSLYYFLFIFRIPLEIPLNRWKSLKNVIAGTDLESCVHEMNKRGRILVDKSATTMEEVEKIVSNTDEGGHWAPTTCESLQNVAILVPFRDREHQLPIFLRHLHRFLQKQNIKYTIFVIEQSTKYAFNRGMLLNIGFLQSSAIDNFDCFIQHDVDLLPRDLRNIYSCNSSHAIRLVYRTEEHDFNIDYRHSVGGALAITYSQYTKVNGMSNLYWGWGAEDNDLYNRLREKGIPIAQRSSDIGIYATLHHKKETKNPTMLQVLAKWKENIKSGIKSCRYKVLDVKKFKLFTKIHVDLIEKKSEHSRKYYESRIKKIFHGNLV